jgi:hypothetical protein
MIYIHKIFLISTYMHLNYLYIRSCSLHVPACFSNSFSMSFHTFPLLRTVHITSFFICIIQRWSPTLEWLQKSFFDEFLQRDALLLCARHGLLICTKDFYTRLLSTYLLLYSQFADSASEASSISGSSSVSTVTADGGTTPFASNS